MGRLAFSFIGQVIPKEVSTLRFDNIKNIVDIAGNTFYVNLLEGIAENGCYVEAFPSEPIDVINEKFHLNGKVKYLPKLYYSNPIKRWLNLLFTCFKQVKGFKLRCKKKKDNGFLIFNVLRISSVIGGLLAAKIYKIKTIGVVTDVPGYRIKTNKKSFVSVITDKMGRLLLNQFDTYVLLSEEMAKVVNISNKPYTIIEGLYGDINDEEKIELTENGDKKQDKIFNIVYAGSLEYRYGVMNLIEAVRRLKQKDIICTIYGKGEAEQEIISVTKSDNRIVFGGLIARDELLTIERKASLLVNPRPIEDEYVKYSFPSKVMEYMASGTPTLLTNIPSLPDEYKNYVILAENNSIDVLKSKIMMCYSYRMNNDYWKIGNEAKCFIIKNKNYVIQARRLVHLTKWI